MTDFRCGNCRHWFWARHFEEGRCFPTAQEQDERRCRDCADCHPPEDARLKERSGEVAGV